MASVVDICNLALALIGEEAIVQSINPRDGTQQASLCERFYPIARDSMLARHAWGFATTALNPAPLAETPREPWAAKYELPSGVVNVLRVEYSPREYTEFQVERGQLYTLSAALNVFVVLRVEDTTKFSPLFVDALAYQLASYLAGAIIKGKNGMQVSMEMRKQAETIISWAKESDSADNYEEFNYTSRHIKARGYTETSQELISRG